VTDLPEDGKWLDVYFRVQYSLAPVLVMNSTFRSWDEPPLGRHTHALHSHRAGAKYNRDVVAAFTTYGVAGVRARLANRPGNQQQQKKQGMPD
jgi:hypothetical protein